MRHTIARMAGILLTVSVSVSLLAADPDYSKVEEQIRSLATDGPTDEELDKAKKYITGSYALNFDTSTKIAGQLVRIQVDDLGIDYMERRNGLVEAVTLEDATRAAKRLYGEGKLLVAVVGQPVGL